MGKRLASGVAMLVVGAVLLVTAAFAGGSRSHGIFKLAVVGPGDTMDPQLTYNTLSWSLEYATAAKLFNFPDKSGGAGSLPVPEVAKSYRISKDGKTYTFFIRRGFRFSDGTKVTAKSFAFAFARVLSPQLQSPGASFIRDVVGYKAKGDRFVVRLSHPDPGLVATLTMPFFQATSTKLPVNQAFAGPIPTAGPYYVASNDPNTKTVLLRNPHYHGRRPHHVKGVTAFYNQNTETAFLGTLHNRFDEGPIPPDQVRSVASRFGVNRTRFWVKPTSCEGFILLNDQNGLFHGNAAMRKAFNWALDRKAYSLASGPYARTIWTQILVPGTPGLITRRKAQPFTPGPNLKKARTLAAGHFKNGKITVFYRSSGITGPRQRVIVERNLRRLGFEQGKIRMVGFPGTDIYDALQTRHDWDLVLSIGSCQDYPNKVDFVRQLFRLTGFQLPPKYAARLKAIEKLKEPARSRAFGKFALRVMRKLAPVVPTALYNNLYLLSNRVRPRSLVYQFVYTDWDLAAIRLK